MQRTLGIDLGTTNSVMAHMWRGEPQVISNRDNIQLTASVVGRGKRGELLVGKSARSRAGIDPQNTIASIKRLMGRTYSDADVQKAIQLVSYQATAGADGNTNVRLGDYEYSPIEISALILRRLKEDAEARIGEPFTRAVITVPAYFGERQVAATREAGRMAGFHVLRVINEPTAAALAYGFNREQPDESKTILVFDLGGGTFDISILMLVQGTFAVMGIEGDNLLGGDDFDRILAAHLLDELHREYGVDLSKDREVLYSLSSKAEEVKISLSMQNEVDAIVPALGPQFVTLETTVSRPDFEALIGEQIDRTIKLTQKAIQSSHLTSDQIDHVLLVGGSTAIPLVEQSLQAIFGPTKIRKDINPMLGVAMGAALQSALITEVECLACQHVNPVVADYCQHCQEPLFGRDKVTCPTCYTLSDADVEQCRKCGGSLVHEQSGNGQTKSNVHRTTFASSAATETCPQCGKPYRLGDTSCSICGKTLIDQGGLKCSTCGSLNMQGAQLCAHCGEPMSVTDLIDMTAKDLGIELSDGRMAVLIAKGTNFPTVNPFSKEFYTSIHGQQRLEVSVYEGPETMAKQNDLCGIVTMRLPDGLPRGTPVNIAFGLDRDRTITVSVKLRSTFGEVKTVRLQRTRNPEDIRKIDAAIEQLTQFLDKWTEKEELTEAETQAINATLNELDSAINEDPANRKRPLSELLFRAEQVEKVAQKVRGISAMLSAVLTAGGKYLPEDKRQKLMQYRERLAQEREDGWLMAESIANEAENEIWSLSGSVMLIIHCRTMANQFQLSPSLDHRIRSALHDVDQGLEEGDRERTRRGIDELNALWDTLTQELELIGERPPALTGVLDRI